MLLIKPRQTRLRYSWCIAAWRPSFTRFMHEYLALHQEADGSDQPASEQPELFVGDVIQAAIQDGLQVDAVPFPDGVCLDIGTPEGLIQAVRDHTP